MEVDCNCHVAVAVVAVVAVVAAVVAVAVDEAARAEA